MRLCRAAFATQLIQLDGAGKREACRSDIHIFRAFYPGISLLAVQFQNSVFKNGSVFENQVVSLNFRPP